MAGDECSLELNGMGLFIFLQTAESQYESAPHVCRVEVPHLDEVDVVLSARQLCDLLVPPLQIGDLVGQTLHVALRVVQRRPLVGGDQLGHLLLHPLDGTDHVAERLLTFLQCSLG